MPNSLVSTAKSRARCHVSLVARAPVRYLLRDSASDLGYILDPHATGRLPYHYFRSWQHDGNWRTAAWSVCTYISRRGCWTRASRSLGGRVWLRETRVRPATHAHTCTLNTYTRARNTDDHVHTYHLFLVETSPSQESPAQTRHASLPDVTDTAPATGQALAVKQSKTPSEIALRALSPEIEEYLDVDIILPHLLRCHLLTKYEQEEHLFFPRDRTRKTRDLIIRLSNKGPKAFDLFVECLINSSEGHSSHRELAMKLKAEKEKAEQDLAKRKGGSGEKRQEAEEELQAQQRSQSFGRSGQQRLLYVACVHQYSYVHVNWSVTA